ncbi:MAG: PEGA domain-containing protein [Myxococcota bacterium]
MLFEMLSGRRPFEGDNPLAVAARVVNDAAPPLASVLPSVSPGQARLVDSALSREPSQRPRDAAAFRDELARLAPPDLSWPFTVAAALMRRQAQAPEPASRPATVTRASTSALEVTAAAPLQRLAGPLPARAAARVACDLLLDPQAPPLAGTGTVLLSEEGTVRATRGAPKVLRVGSALRTSAGPEVWRGERTSNTLQFSVGCLLFELCTGRPLFEAADEAALLAKVGSGEVPHLGPGVPAALQAVIGQMVDPDPSRRFATPGACAQAIGSCFGGAFSDDAGRVELGTSVRNVARAGANLAPAPSPPQMGLAQRLVRLLAAVVLASLVAVLVVGWRLRAMVDELKVNEQLEVVSPAELAPATLVLGSTPPGARLYVNGEVMGETPGTLTLSPDADWKVELRLPGYRSREETVRLRPGESRQLDWTLEPAE